MSDGIDYEGEPLHRSDLGANPLAALETWVEDAVAAGERQPYAMALATIDPDGRPALRFVLLRGVDDRGLVFFTDGQSRKARGIAHLQAVSAVLYWPLLHRQVRCDGSAKPVNEAEADRYWTTRPRGARVAATISHQSVEVPSRTALEAAFAAGLTELPEPVPRPERWGGYRIAPESIEFWQGRRNRLHDRIRFDRSGGSWRRSRLAP